MNQFIQTYFEELKNKNTDFQKESESIIDPNNIKYHESRVKDATDLLRQMNPVYDKEIRRDEEIDTLKQ